MKNWTRVSAEEVAEIVRNDALFYVKVTEENIEELKEVINPFLVEWIGLKPGERISYWEGQAGDVILFHNRDRAAMCLNDTVLEGDILERDGVFYINPEKVEPIPITAPAEWTPMWLRRPHRKRKGMGKEVVAVEKKTIAEQVAEALGGDGKDFSRWEEVLGQFPHWTVAGASAWIHVFVDDSAIVETDNWWALEEEALRDWVEVLEKHRPRVSRKEYIHAWEWFSLGFTPQEVEAWLAAGCYRAYAAYLLEKLGCTPEMAAKTTESGMTIGYAVANGDMTVAEIVEFLTRKGRKPR